MTHPLRDYSLPNSEPDGVPEVGEETGQPCPNCHCPRTFMIKVRVKQRLVKGGVGTANYVGCAACPWASPAVIVADGVADGVADNVQKPKG